jgi:hypothetical protein
MNLNRSISKKKVIGNSISKKLESLRRSKS